MPKAKAERDVVRYADMFSAMGTELRLRIMRLLLLAHPQGTIAGDIGAELEIPPSTLSHHLDKLKNEDLVNVRKVPISGILPTARRCRNCSAFFTPNAARVTKQSSRRPSCSFANNDFKERTSWK